MSKDYIFEPRPIFSSYTPNLLLGSYYIEDGFQADPTMWNDPLEDAFVNNAGMKEGMNDDEVTYLNDFSAETVLMGTKKLDELEVLPQSYFWKWVNYDGQLQIPTEMSEDDFESPAYEKFMEDAVGYDADNPYFLLVVDSFMDDGEDVDIWAEDADWNRMQTTTLWWKLYDLWMENEGVDFLTTLAEENYDWALSNAYELQQIGYEIPEPDDDDYYWSMRQAESFAANDPWSYRGLLLKPANHVGRSKICDAKGCSKVKKHSRKSWGIPYHFCDRHQEEIDDTYSAENESHWMTFGRVDYNWATDPDDLELTDEDFWVIDEHIRNEVRYEIDTNNLPGESNISSWTLSLTEEDEDEFTIYYYWGAAQTTGVNSAESFEAPYTGAGSLMGISGDTDLSSFTSKELTESSAIHGDFDTASLDYSGHQNIEVRAETFEAPYTGPGATMNIGQDTDLSSFTPDELTKSSAIHGDFDTASLDYSGHQNIEVRAESSAYADPAEMKKFYKMIKSVNKPDAAECDLCPWKGELGPDYDRHLAYDCPGTSSIRKQSIELYELLEREGIEALTPAQQRAVLPAHHFRAESFASEGPYECGQCREYGDYDPGEAPAAEEECDDCGDSICIGCYTNGGALCMSCIYTDQAE